ncbi:hypothetical protein METP1_00763 [Methanosarcinales archaeon]|nr:hypothetical protein METP1_00763 [Methanosarcinales archaeon]
MENGQIIHINRSRTILVHKAREDVYWAEVPALPGCYSKGETIEKTIEKIKDGVSFNRIERI